MKTVEIKTDIPYQVLIGTGLLADTGRYVREITKAGKVCVITDDRVNALYGDRVIASLTSAGFETCRFVFPNGEAQKTVDTWYQMVCFLAEEHLTRSDLVVALGGGVTGDLAGFAAASYLRGIDYVQIPTTLLAAVDSSVGGKTAFDLPAGKNLCGAFWQPRLVICDYDTLSTLLPETFADGVAESVKYGILGSEPLFARFESGEIRDCLEEMIAECVAMKRDVVMEDEHDNGRRQFLNLGHTFGHAIEKNSGFTITHGHAVAIGTVLAAEIAASLGLCPGDCPSRIRRTLERHALPVTTQMDAETLASIACSDKKRRGDRITLILPEAVGRCRLYPAAVEELPALCAAGLMRMHKADAASGKEA